VVVLCKLQLSRTWIAVSCRAQTGVMNTPVVSPARRKTASSIRSSSKTKAKAKVTVRVPGGAGPRSFPTKLEIRGARGRPQTNTNNTPRSVLGPATRRGLRSPRRDVAGSTSSAAAAVRGRNRPGVRINHGVRRKAPGSQEYFKALRVWPPDKGVVRYGPRQKHNGAPERPVPPPVTHGLSHVTRRPCR